jgi:hypothetical protein
MTKETAKKIGRNEAFKSVTIGLIVAQVIMTLLSSETNLFKGFFWFIEFNYKLNVVIAIIAIYLCAYFYGQIAGKAIIINGKDHLWTGFLYGLLTLVTSTFLASWTGFFQEGIDNLGTSDEPFNDYIIKPLFWVTIFGIVPVLIVGFWFGSRIREKGRNYR